MRNSIFQIPFIYASTIEIIPPYSEKMGDLYFSSVTPSILFSYTHPLPFAGRLLGLVSNIANTYSYYWVLST